MYVANLLYSITETNRLLMEIRKEEKIFAK